MNNQLSKEQIIQEEEYAFPYHYLPERGEKVAVSRSWGWSLKYIGAFDLIFERLRKLSFASIIDIGTGDGRLLREINKEFPEKESVGIDYSEKAIAYARALNPTLNYERFDILEDNWHKQYDCGTLVEVFEHIPVELCKRFAAGVADLIKPGGYLFVTVPHRNAPLQDKHFQHFTLESLEAYFTKDFAREEVVFLHPDNFANRFVQYLLFNKYVTIKYAPLVQRLYRYYYRNGLVADREETAKRVMVVFRRL